MDPERECVMTPERMLRELKTLAGYYRDLQVEAFVLPGTAERPLPTLTALLPEHEGDERVIGHSFLPVPAACAASTKLLQFYTEVPVPQPGPDRQQLLEAVCALNDSLPLGRCTVSEKDGEEQTVGLRWVQAVPLDVCLDRDSFAESLALFDGAGELIRHTLEKLAEGSTPEQIMEELT